MSDHRTTLITLLTNICENNDHVTALAVLQTLSKVKRAGYISIDDIVSCLSYCSDIFAKQENMEFFNEFTLYMSDITEPSPNNPFSLKSRCFYYLAKNKQVIMQRVQKYCDVLDETCIDEHISSMIIRNNIVN